MQFDGGDTPPQWRARAVPLREPMRHAALPCAAHGRLLLAPQPHEQWAAHLDVRDQPRERRVVLTHGGAALLVATPTAVKHAANGAGAHARQHLRLLRLRAAVFDR